MTNRKRGARSGVPAALRLAGRRAALVVRAVFGAGAAGGVGLALLDVFLGALGHRGAGAGDVADEVAATLEELPAVGDQVLVEFAKLIQATVRQVDAIYRWGGEEFLIVCPETPPELVSNLTERILDGVRRHRFPTQRTMTVSAGIANLGAGDTMTSLLQRADEALYQAKTTGRDRVCLAPDVSPRDAVDSGDPSGLVQLVWRPAYACGNEVIDRERASGLVRARQHAARGDAR